VGEQHRLLAANREPERFAHLVLLCPSPRYLNDPPDYAGGWERTDLDALLELMARNDLGWAAALAPVVAGNPERPELAGEFEASFCATDPAVARRFAEATFLADNRDDLAAVRVPTLILQASEDLIAPPAVGAYVHGAIPGSRLHVLRATGHAPHLSHPDETAAAIRAYLGAADRA
jgi:sigma-B regulation protein RsbQ